MVMGIELLLLVVAEVAKAVANRQQDDD